MSEAESRQNPVFRWWVEYSVSSGETRGWQIGSWQLQARYDNDEWRLAAKDGSNALDKRLWVNQEVTEESPDISWERYACGQTDGRIRLSPALADRAVVVRPQMPLNIPTAGEAMLYLTLPVRIAVSLSSGHRLFEGPSFRMPDTWFGSNTMEGELCYASTTWARLSVDELDHWPHRAVTPVKIINRASDVLHVEKVKIPLEQLALYSSPDGRLWTNALLVERASDDENASVEVMKNAAEIDAMELISPAQKPAGRGVLGRIFG